MRADARRAERLPRAGALALLLEPQRRAALWTGLALQRDARGFYRVSFLKAALEIGLLPALRAPSSPHQVAAAAGATRGDLVVALLDLGVALGELAVADGRYRLRGRRSRALAADPDGPLAALVREWVAYHGSVFGWLPRGLRGQPAEDYLARFGPTIAQSSRALEPLIGSFAQRAARAAAAAAPDRPRVLEVGCGSGVYLSYAARTAPALTGIGVEIDPTVAREARRNLEAWSIARRFGVVAADARSLRPATPPAFTLVTLYNNVYYFPEAARPALFRALRAHLAPGGALALVSLFRGRDVDAAAFDLVLRSTPGCAPLPDRQTLHGQLVQAGFARIEFAPLTVGTPLYGVLARGATG
ncbi:MAG TPA: class I SAM-dependent methyltransferase [Chloroflexota bacterium]|nr:class I SAM-dependent methyltransferase [Chloroflexota bacterium]